MNDQIREENLSDLVEIRKEIALQRRQENQDNEIDLIELAFVLLDNIHYLILFFLLGAVLLNAYAYGFISPTYTSTASIYIVNASGGSVVDLTDLNIGTSLKNDYRELILSYPVLDRVSVKLQLDWTTDQMKRAIRVDNPADTRILNLTATARTPELAMKIANTLAKVAVEYLPETMSTEAPNIAQKGRLAKTKAAPSYTKYTAMGGMLGLVLCGAWLIMKHLMDDTIRTSEDMEKYFDISPLAAIPYTDVFNVKTGQSDSRQSGRHGKRHKTRHRSSREMNRKESGK